MNPVAAPRSRGPAMPPPERTPAPAPRAAPPPEPAAPSHRHHHRPSRPPAALSPAQPYGVFGPWSTAA